MPIKLARVGSGTPAPKAIPKISGALQARPRPLSHLATRLFNTPLMIEPRKFDAILGALGFGPAFAAAIPMDDDECDDQPYQLTPDGIAHISVLGTLVGRALGMRAMSGLTTYSDIQAQVTQALNDTNVRAILMDFDSPGGETTGAFDLADYLMSIRGEKPMCAIANDSCYSAAYLLGSQTPYMMLGRTNGVGSVGVFMDLVDMTAADEKMGVKHNLIYAGARKVDGNPHVELSDEARARAQAEVDRQYGMFVDAVARGRNVDPQKIRDTEAMTYSADNAMPLMADQVGTLQDAADYLRNQMGAARRSTVFVGRHRQFERSAQLAGISGGAAVHATAIPAHSTATSDSSWDGPANEARLKLNQPGSYYKRAYAQYDPSGDPTKKSTYKFIHHEVSGSGDIGAANVQACRTGIGVLNGARGGTKIPPADRKGVYNHLAKHLRDAKVEPPDFKAHAEYEALIEAWDRRTRDMTSHALSAMEAQRLSLQSTYPDVEAAINWSPVRALAASDSRKISMLVIPYGSLSEDMGGFRETYQPGCFKDGLNNDPRATFGHNAVDGTACYILGRQSTGTAKFYEDVQGVHVEVDAPDTTWANDLLVSMRRGDIDKCSGAFFILKYRWDYSAEHGKIRVVEKALLREAAIVGFGAYDSTSASASPGSPAAQNTAAEVELEQLRARLQLLSAA